MGRSDHQPDAVSDLDDRSRFLRRRVGADARSAARTRIEFATWLERNFALDPERFSDLLLAVNEAIANAAEFAYADATHPGTLDVSAAYDADADVLAVTIDDRGRWRSSVPVELQPQHRGRGIPLMEALADEVAINRTPHGTQVTLTWARVTRSAPAPEPR